MLPARLSGACLSWILAFATGFILPAQAQNRANLLLDVTLNDQEKRLVGNFIRDDTGQIGATASELEEVGIHTPQFVKEPEAVVLLNSIAGVTYTYDETKQQIVIHAPLDALAQQKIDLGPKVDEAGDKLEPAQREWGGLVNYSLFASGSRDLATRQQSFNGYSANLETRAFTPIGTLTQTQLLVGSDAHIRNIKATRLDTTFSYSDPDTRITYRAGDTISGGLAWTRPLRMGGLQAQRNFGLRADLITLPLPSISGSAAVPSSVDLYINNVKTSTQDVSSGPFQINNVPAISGSGTARIVVRDATGKQIEQSVPFFISSKMLKQGLADFSVEAGFARQNYASENFTYSHKPLAMASLRYGLRDWLTLEGHAEGTQRFGMAGAGVNVATFGYGVLSLAGSASWFGKQGVGAQIYGSYDFQFKGLTFGVSSQRTFRAFNDLAGVTAPVNNASATAALAAQVSGLGGVFDFGSVRPPKAIDKISIGIPLVFDTSTLNLSFVNVVDGGGKTARIASVSYSRSLPFKGTIFATAYHDFAKSKSTGVFAGLSFPITDDISVSSGASRSNSGNQFGMQASKSIKPEAGSYGWRVTDNEGVSSNRAAAVAYRSGIAQIEGGVSQAGRGVTGSMQVDGSVAVAGGGVFAGPRINDAFAIVDVGAPGVPVAFDNRYIGETNSSGKMLVPDLRSFQKNRINIDPLKLPLNASIGSTQEIVVPADGGVAYANFGVQAETRTAIVALTDAAGKPLKPGLSGVLNEVEPFIIGYDGLAFIKNLAADNRIVVHVANGECRGQFAYKASVESQTRVGPVRCQ